MRYHLPAAWSIAVLCLTCAALNADSVTDFEEETARRAIVIVEPAITAEKLAASLPSGVTIEDSVEDLFVLISDRRVDEELFQKLERIPGVESVTADEVVPETAPPIWHSLYKRKDSTRPVGDGSAAKCDLGDRCADGRSKFWAQEAVDAPAMKRRLRSNSQTVNVAVVDSGFDSSQGRAFSSAVKTRRGSLAMSADGKRPAFGDPNADESGHGTMVASAIAGKDGIGVAENVALSVYRTTAPGNFGFTSKSKINTSIYRACFDNPDPDGLTIINVSWGGATDESGSERDELSKAILLKRLAQRGCLVVKSAGNDNYRRKHATDNLDDAYLRVAAVDPTRGLSGFSTVGEVSAPGSGVFMVQSSGSAKSVESDNRCLPADTSKRNPRRFANGTSFASPIVSGIASQIIRALKSGRRFRTLKPADRIALVNRILKASEINQSVNGLRAVAIAEGWNKVGGLMPVAELAQLLVKNPDPICSGSAVRCETMRICTDVKSCFETGKERAALCPFSKSEAASMARTALRHGYREPAMAFARMAGYDPELTKGALDSYFSHVKTPEKFNVSGLSEVAVPYLEACTQSRNCDTATVRRVLDAISRSKKINLSARRTIDPKTGEDRGSRETMSAITRAFKLASDAIGEDATVTFLREISLKPATRAMAARNLANLIFDPATGPSLAARARALEVAMRDDIRRTKEFVVGPPSLFDRMIQRDLAPLNRAVASGDLSGLSALEIRYIMRNFDKNPDWKRRKNIVMRNVLSLIARGRGWGKPNDANLKLLAQNELKPVTPRYPRSRVADTRE